MIESNVFHGIETYKHKKSEGFFFSPKIRALHSNLILFQLMTDTNVLVELFGKARIT